ncbi:MAG: DNA-directed RNA polymerase subunit omega [bacterium]|nr:DNA-directed RNA polymerase subunit omega [bacterium]
MGSTLMYFLFRISYFLFLNGRNDEQGQERGKVKDIMNIEQMEKLFSKSQNKYYLLTLVAQRACQVEAGAGTAVQPEINKPNFIALAELVEDKIQYKEVK